MMHTTRKSGFNCSFLTGRCTKRTQIYGGFDQLFSWMCELVYIGALSSGAHTHTQPNWPPVSQQRALQCWRTRRPWLAARVDAAEAVGAVRARVGRGQVAFKPRQAAVVIVRQQQVLRKVTVPEQFNIK